MSKKSVVLVANGSEAIIYKYIAGGTALEEDGGQGNGLRKHRDQDIVTDRPGVMSGGGSHIHGKDAMTTEESPTERAKGDFARSVVDELDKDRRSSRLQSVDIIAEPSMLGLLRDSMDDNLLKIVDQTISKDAIGKSTEEILEMLKSDRT